MIINCGLSSDRYLRLGRASILALIACLCSMSLPAQLASSAPSNKAQSAPEMSSAPGSTEPMVLDPFEVRTAKDVGYRASNSISALRMDAPVKNIPQSISIYMREWLDDTNASEAADALAYDPLFINNNPPRGGGAFNIRGFSSSLFLRDGQIMASGFGTTVPVANVQRIEVLKGPSAILYGAGNVGGVMNLIPKRPLFTDYAQYRFIGGFNDVSSEKIYRFEADWTGPITKLPFVSDYTKLKKNALAYRLNVATESTGQYRDGAVVKSTVIAPSVSWQMGPDTGIVFDVLVDRTRFTPMWEQPASIINGKLVFGQRRPDGSIAEFKTGKQSFSPDADREARVSTNFIFNYDFRHRFSDHVSFRSQGYYQDFGQRWQEYQPVTNLKYPVNLDPVTGVPVFGYTNPTTGVFTRNAAAPGDGVAGLDYIVPRRARIYAQGSEILSSTNEFVFKFKHPFAEHSLLAGGAVLHQDADVSQAAQTLASNPTTLAAYQLVSVFYPTGGGPMSYLKDTLGTTGSQFPALNQTITDVAAVINRSDLHAYDLISMFDQRFNIAAGFRYQRDKRTNFNRAASNARASTDVKSTTASYGAVFHVLSNQSLSLFANANEAFEPQTAVSPDGYALPPIRSKQKEGGLKFEFLQGRLSGTASYFDIFRKNIPVSIDSLGNLRPNGEGVRSRGYEVNVNYTVSKNWQLLGGFGAQRTRDFSRPVGYAGPLEFNNVPRNGSSLFSNYKFTSGALKGFNVNVGGRYKGARWIDWSNRPDLALLTPSSWTLDGSVGYTWKAGSGVYSAIMNVTNITNEEGMGFANFYSANPIIPRQVRFELRIKY